MQLHTAEVGDCVVICKGEFNYKSHGTAAIYVSYYLIFSFSEHASCTYVHFKYSMPGRNKNEVISFTAAAG
jgi:hypothetical protein